MKYYSLNCRSPKVDFKEATILGQAPDKGLYFPEHIPLWSKDFISSLKGLDKVSIGYEIMKPFVGDCIPKNELNKIMADALSFEFPLKKINDSIYSLELFHGPTLAFKDLGARFLSRCLGYFAQSQEKKIYVLVATSGDTGGAVADGFYKVPGTEVIILYPSGKVSEVQEKQLTGLGQNIHALEVKGDFDDCQRMVKMAFTDQDLKQHGLLTSANSINISRWLSQQIYYAIALSQWEQETPPAFCVPSGNFGNICAGLLASLSGLPVNQFIAACNSNDVFTRYIESGNYVPRVSTQTISNAMDVGDPSNFVRILEMFEHNIDTIRNHMSSYAFSDLQTEEIISNVYKDFNYILDPHTAIAFGGMLQWLQKNPGQKGIILSTAHPLKFPSVVEKIIGKKIEVPKHVEKIMQSEKKSIITEPIYEDVKSILLEIMH